MTSSKSKAKPYSLLRSFSITSLITLLVVSSVAASLVSEFLRESLLARDAQVMRQIIQSVAEKQNTAAYFTAKDFGESKMPLDEFFNSISLTENVIRAHAYTRDGKIIWSSDERMIGLHFPDNQELKNVLSGGTVYEFSELSQNQHEKAEHIRFEPEIQFIVGNYIPIHSSTDQSIVGVLEIYRQPIELIETIDRGIRLVWLVLLASGALLYVALFWIVYRAQKVMTAQEIALADVEKNVVVGEMASVVAHSIRNPIASIRSSAELAVDEVRGLAKNCMGDIIVEVDRLESWVKELLAFWAQEGGDQLVYKAHVRGVIDASISDFARRTDLQRFTIRVDSQSNLPTARCDPKLLQYVFNALISNAIESMPRGGELGIYPEVSPDQLRITFRGIGVADAANKLESNFEPKVDTNYTRLGMGLSLAKQILARFGGWLEYDDFEGDVTSITVVLLPAKQEQ